MNPFEGMKVWEAIVFVLAFLIAGWFHFVYGYISILGHFP